ncbi:MAG: ribose 5-phosphate isomerase B [Anaerolineae bacterium]
MAYSENEIRTIVRRVLLRTLGMKDEQVSGPPARATVTESDVLAVPYGGQLNVPAEALVTPLARDAALDRNVALLREPGQRPATSKAASGPDQRTVALGADHGGYALKENLKEYLDKLGYDVIDCGTHGTDSVDYPDFAYAVARLVSQGRAWRGIVVDGAGIGSCMAANKVPGIRAAMCYDHATAVNSREHNDANVLTLGGMLLGQNLAQQIVKSWLETAFGGGRHARRVDKIMEIERRYLRK